MWDCLCITFRTVYLDVEKLINKGLLSTCELHVMKRKGRYLLKNKLVLCIDHFNIDLS